MATPPTLDREFPCSTCGARLGFAPGTDALECPYCGAKTTIATAPKGPVREIALEDGLKAARKVEASSLTTGGHEVSCGTCGAIAVVAGQADRCSFCDAPVVLRNEADPVLAPESLLPFKIAREAANDKYKAWVASRWFAPNDLKDRSQRRGMDGVYVPYWTFDAATHTRYQGQRGEHYWEEEHYTENKQRKTRKVRKTRWHSASGAVDVPFDDVLVCASKGLKRNLAEGLEPWDLPDLRPYEPSFLAGFVAERYSVDLQAGFEIAGQRMRPTIEAKIRKDIGGDDQRILSMATRNSNVMFKHVLLPVWLSSFRYNEKVYTFLVNARTGAVSGERPYSWIKITLAVLAVLFVLFVLTTVVGGAAYVNKHH